MKTASVFGFLIASAALSAMAIRHSLFGTGAISIGIQVASLFLLLWARWTFGRRSYHVSADPTEGGLVTRGPYRFWRHPVYAAAIYIALAGLGSHFDIVNLGLASATVGGLAIRMWAEEKLVIRRYPEYAEYAARTKRVIPFVL